MVACNIMTLHTSKLDIGYWQKVGDVVNLKFGYWILTTKMGY